MPITLSHPSQKQSLLVIIGVGIAVVLLLVLGSVYGRFLKTQVASSDRDFTEDTALKTENLDPGVYTLRLRAENDSRIFAQASTTFEIIPNLKLGWGGYPNPREGEQAAWIVDITNVGNASSPASTIYFCIDDTVCSSTSAKLLSSHTILAIQPNSNPTKVTSALWTATVGAHNIIACTNKDNCLTKDFTVKSNTIGVVQSFTVIPPAGNTSAVASWTIPPVQDGCFPFRTFNGPIFALEYRRVGETAYSRVPSERSSIAPTEPKNSADVHACNETKWLGTVTPITQGGTYDVRLVRIDGVEAAELATATVSYPSPTPEPTPIPTP